MNKTEFFAELKKRLKGLPERDLHHSFEYYGEMIDDRVEDGMTEEEAVAALGSVDKIVVRILEGASLFKLMYTRIKPKRTLRTWEIVLLVLGFPLWLPLLIAVAAVALSVYVVLWSAVVSLYATDAALFGGGAGVALWSLLVFAGGHGAAGSLWLGCGIFSLGLAIFGVFACNIATKGAVWLGKRMVLGTKALLIGKERAK